MAHGVVHHFPGQQEELRRMIAAVHPAGGRPAGQVCHAAGPSTGGWNIVAVHKSRESGQSFRDDVLIRRMQAGIEGGFRTPPQDTAIEIDTLLP